MPKRSTAERDQRRERLVGSYDRRENIRQPRESILIVCEGVQTEPNYFRSLRHHLKLLTVEVEVEGLGVAPTTLVDMANEKNQRGSRFTGQPFDEVWCVIDREGHRESPSFRPAIDKAKALQFELAVSNPCFEYWYLLHYQSTDKPFGNADALLRALKRKDCIRNYDKGMDVFTILPNKLDEVIVLAERLLMNHPDQSDFPDPSTTVYRLVRKLKQMASQ